MHLKINMVKRPVIIHIRRD